MSSPDRSQDFSQLRLRRERLSAEERRKARRELEAKKRREMVFEIQRLVRTRLIPASERVSR